MMKPTLNGPLLVNMFFLALDERRSDTHCRKTLGLWGILIHSWYACVS